MYGYNLVAISYEDPLSSKNPVAIDDFSIPYHHQFSWNSVLEFASGVPGGGVSDISSHEQPSFIFTEVLS